MDDNLSGVPPVVTLSGLQGVPSFSGATQQAPASGMSGYGAAQPGIEGGPDLLSLMLAQAGQGGAGDTGVGSLTPFTAGSIGQQTGGISAGSFGQQQPGQMGTAGATAQSAQQAAGAIDPVAMMQKLFGLAGKLGGFLGGAATGTASPTLGDTGGASMSDQVRSSAGGTGSPQPGVLTLGSSGAMTASPTGDVNAQGVPPGFQDPNALGGLAGSATAGGGAPDLSLTNTFGQGQAGQTQALYDALKGAGFSDSDIIPILQQVGAGEGFSAGEIPGGGASIPSGISGAPTASPTTSLSGTQGTNLGGAIQSGAQAGGGLLNILQAIQQGNVGQGVGGALQGIGGAAGLAKAIPQIADAIGVSSDALSAIGATAGGLGSILGLVQGIQSGNPIQIGTSLYSILPAINALAGTEAGAAALGGLGLGATGAAAGTTASGLLGAAAPALGAASAFALPVAALAAIAADAAASSEEMNARQSGWWNNPIAGQLLSNATAGVGADQGILDRIQKAGGVQGLDVATEEQLLPSLLNNLQPYYQTAQGGASGLRASSALQGLYGRPGLGGQDEYTQKFTTAQQGTLDVLKDLMSKGVSYQELGNLPGLNPNWGMQTLDAAGNPTDLYAKNAAQYNQQAQPFIQRALSGLQQTGLNNENYLLNLPGAPAGSDPAVIMQGMLTPQVLLQAALGSAPSGPDMTKTGGGTHAAGLESAMYGGPLWEAIARMGAGGPELQGLIQQNFNPWAGIQGFTPQQLQTSLFPLIRQLDLGGQGIGGAIGIGGEGSSSSPPGDAPGGAGTGSAY